MRPLLFVVLSAATVCTAVKAVAQGNAPLVGVQRYNLDSTRVGSFNNVLELFREDWDTRTSVRWDIAKPLSAFAYQVYEDQPIITRYFLSSMGFAELIEMPYETMYGYIAVKDDVMVICFRGTNLTSFSDWRVNCQTGQVEYRGHYFHSGFLDNYRAMRSTIASAIREYSPKHVWVTGHSLGGALATICATDLTLSSSLRPTLCTFGQPRVADSGGSRLIDETLSRRYARFVNGSDVVPSLPPTLPFIWTYGHAGDLYAFGESKLTISESATTEPAIATAYCEQCGRPAKIDANEIIYQSAAELPPLSQQEYDSFLMQEERQGRFDGTRGIGDENFYAAGPADLFLDHKMGNYVQAAHSFGSSEKVLAIPGR
ncbi:lipase family protein [Crateriforma spongiae]|uniref:lipase family protein n=1 Tax=Crateriforma spongiae TaxID=2724528 RepID=UPI001446A521|nr:lipase family protein [Crateriforma spongiae]